MILKHVEGEAEAAGFRRLEMGSTLTGVPLYSLRGYRELEKDGDCAAEWGDAGGGKDGERCLTASRPRGVFTLVKRVREYRYV